ncbi:MAG: ATP-binding cassette domain-containing protein [Spirochaetaceae bacterium]|jgi:osmoprotectant transport system ATP-binding protein|nr:ATP-binding cassette domain-containing protein [Spirochaetaceae bacterium]
MPVIVFKDVRKHFPGALSPALNHISFNVEVGEFITVVGTSGSGKTTLLKIVNRLCEPDSGMVRVSGEDITKKDPVLLRRGIGYVIQQIGLFPHMTVADNIAVVPRILKWDRGRIKKRVEELLTLVNLDPEEFRERRPAQLSGGQQQRVGLARALAADPAIMLLDEPFGAVDAINRTNLQSEILRIHRGENGENRRTYLFVTHDMNEAFKLGTRVLIMHQGVIQQFDAPHNIIADPANSLVRNLITSSGLSPEGPGGI